MSDETPTELNLGHGAASERGHGEPVIEAHMKAMATTSEPPPPPPKPIAGMENIARPAPPPPQPREE